MIDGAIAAKDTRALKANRMHTALNSAGVYIIVALLVVLGMILSRDFHTCTNLVNTVKAVALLGIVAVGVAFVTYSGHYADLSIPATMAFSGIMAISTIKYGIGVSLVTALTTGISIGMVNGLIIGWLRVNPIIWTLAMNAIMDGYMRWAYSGTQIYPDTTYASATIFLGLYGRDLPGGIPLIVVVLAVLVLIGHFVMKHSGYGARLKLVGSSYPAAVMTGIHVPRVVAGAFVISSVAASIGGILLASLNKVGAPYLGKDYDFMAVTAVVLGGVTLAGGRGNIFGVLGGVLVIGLMRNIMTLLTVGTFVQDIIQGAVFVLVVGINAYYLRRSGRDDA